MRSNVAKAPGSIRKALNRLFPYLLLLPSLIPILVILIYPILKTAYMSLCKISTQKPDSAEFIGFDNYSKMFQSGSFYLGLKNSVFLTVWTVVFAILLGLGIALILNMNFRGRGFFRSITILPWATPQVAAVLVWMWLFDYQFGMVNYMCSSLGIISKNISWLTDPKVAIISVLIVNIWKYFAISAIMLLAGLQTIDTTLYEAAKVDGANVFQRFFHITLPGLHASGGILVLLVTIWSFREYTTIKLMTNGGPARATETLVIQTYMEAFQYYKMGSAAAMGMVTFLISLLFSALYYWLVFGRKKEKT